MKMLGPDRIPNDSDKQVIEMAAAVIIDHFDKHVGEREFNRALNGVAQGICVLIESFPKSHQEPLWNEFIELLELVKKMRKRLLGRKLGKS